MNLWALIWSWWMNRFMLYIFYEENWSQPTLWCRRCHHQDSWSQQTLWCKMFGLGAPQISKPAQIMKWHATGFLRKSHPTVWVFFSHLVGLQTTPTKNRVRSRPQKMLHIPAPWALSLPPRHQHPKHPAMASISSTTKILLGNLRGHVSRLDEVAEIRALTQPHAPPPHGSKTQRK